MSCCICSTKERSANEEREYICSVCLAKFMAMEREQVRELALRLNNQGKKEAAVFVSKVTTGSDCLIRPESIPTLRLRSDYQSPRPNIQLRARLR